MIVFLRGKVAAVEPEAVVLDVNGIGYRVNVTAECAARLSGSKKEVQLHTRMIVREDDIQLYGFRTSEEIEAFTLLLGVNGVGPRAALSILSVLTPRGLGRALAAEDIPALTRVPGVGKKTAQRLVLELKDKFTKLQPALAELPTRQQAARVSLLDEAKSALAALGYGAEEAGEALRKVIQSWQGDGDLAELVTGALRLLDKKNK